jgi:hypothetical protein
MKQLDKRIEYGYSDYNDFWHMRGVIDFCREPKDYIATSLQSYLF